MRLGSLKPGDLFTFTAAGGEPLFVTHESEPPHRMLCRRWAAWHDPAELLPSDLPVTKLKYKQATQWYEERHQFPRPPKRQGTYGRFRRWSGSGLYPTSEEGAAATSPE
jgi:hypothetical protein